MIAIYYGSMSKIQIYRFTEKISFLVYMTAHYDSRYVFLTFNIFILILPFIKDLTASGNSLVQARRTGEFMTFLESWAM